MNTITHLNSAAQVLGLAVTALEEEIRGLKKADLSVALRGWYLTREEYETLDAVRKRLNSLLEGMSRNDLPEIMSEENVKTVTLDDIGRRFTVNNRFSCSVLEGRKDDALGWLRDNGHGGLIQLTVNSSTLAAFAQTQLKEGKELPPAFFKTSIMKFTSASKI
jgi:hypothetical protein